MFSVIKPVISQVSLSVIYQFDFFVDCQPVTTGRGGCQCGSEATAHVSRR